MIIQQISAYKTYRIRKNVLRKNIPLPYKFEGDFAKTTFHLGALEAEKVIGIASFMKVNHKLLSGVQYQLRGMAVDAKYQKKGIGKLLVNEAIVILSKKNINMLWCNAREEALDFYLKQDFEIFGSPCFIKYIGNHYKMYKKII